MKEKRSKASNPSEETQTVPEGDSFLLGFVGAGVRWVASSARAEILGRYYNRNHHPADFRKAAQMALKSLGFENTFTQNAAALDNYALKRGQLDALNSVKSGATPVIDSLKNKAATSPHALAALKALEDPSPAFRTDKEKLAVYLSQFHSLLGELGTKYRAEDLVHGLLMVKSEIVTAIKAQQKAEMDTLNDPEFKSNLQAALGLDDAQFVTLRDNLQTAIKTKHKTELDAFEKDFTGTIEQLQQESDKNQLQSLQIAHMYNAYSKRMREAIEQAMPSQTNIGIEQTADGQVSIRGITLKDIQDKLETITGRRLVYDAAKKTLTYDESTLFGYKMLGGIKDFLRLKEASKADLISMAEILRAQGYKTISFEVTTQKKDEKAIMESARQKFEAGLLAGFSADQINVIVNGQEISYAKAFAGHPKMQARIEKQASLLNAARNDAALNVTKPETPASPHAMQDIKAALQSAYDDYKSKQAQTSGATTGARAAN